MKHSTGIEAAAAMLHAFRLADLPSMASRSQKTKLRYTEQPILIRAGTESVPWRSGPSPLSPEGEVQFS